MILLASKKLVQIRFTLNLGLLSFSRLKKSSYLELLLFSRPQTIVLWGSMVGVAQLVRAPGCGPGGRRFKSGRPPFVIVKENGL